MPAKSHPVTRIAFMKNIFAAFYFLFFAAPISFAQVTYPYPLDSISLTSAGQHFSMAYMDVRPSQSNGKTLLLLHGKNFNGYYWKDIIPWLVDKGYRVVAPDQVGWGRSGKPVLSYSFHWLASNTRTLLDSLKITSVIVLGHSMGGMLAARFTLMYPELVQKLILENPIGLEDYKRFVPYRAIDSIYNKERSATYEMYRKYQESYYPEWKPEYDQYVKAQAAALTDPSFDKIAWVNALTYQMIYEQPVIYELSTIKIPTLLVIGQKDRTIVGKDLLNAAQKKMYGQYPVLGRKVNRLIKGSRLVELETTGHIPHIQSLQAFKNALLQFL